MWITIDSMWLDFALLSHNVSLAHVVETLNFDLRKCGKIDKREGLNGG